MAPKSSAKIPLTFTRTMVWILVVGYSFFLVGRSTYQNYKMNQDIADQKQRISLLTQAKHNLELSLVFYKSNSFKEIEARRHLLLKGPDEHVVALPQASSEPSLDVVTTTSPVQAAARQIPPYQAWWNLFFGH